MACSMHGAATARSNAAAERAEHADAQCSCIQKLLNTAYSMQLYTHNIQQLLMYANEDDDALTADARQQDDDASGVTASPTERGG